MDFSFNFYSEYACFYLFFIFLTKLKLKVIRLFLLFYSNKKKVKEKLISIRCRNYFKTQFDLTVNP